MERKMEKIDAEISGGMILLSQPSIYNPDLHETVCIHPSQVDTVIQWLRNMKTEIEHAPAR